MRKIRLKIHTSLDGDVRGSDDDTLDWVFKTYDDELQQWEVDGLWAAGTHIMGRNLYEDMAGYWPTSNEPFAPPTAVGITTEPAGGSHNAGRSLGHPLP